MMTCGRPLALWQRLLPRLVTSRPPINFVNTTNPPRRGDGWARSTTTTTTITTTTTSRATTTPPPASPRRRWPAEWEPHSACLLIWPHNPGTFREAAAAAVYTNLIRAIATVGQEDVIIIRNTTSTTTTTTTTTSHSDDEDEDSSWQQQIEEIRKAIIIEEESSSVRSSHQKSRSRIRTIICPSNDSWVRDTGPTFVIATAAAGTGTRTAREQEEDEPAEDDPTSSSSSLVGLDWGFNAHGHGVQEGYHWPFDADQALAQIVCHQLGYASEDHQNFILEGGSIHTDGDGTILTTKECLLNQNRNPHLSPGDIERYVLAATGCTKMIWLDLGLANDDATNGHIDNMCCFTGPATVVLAWTDDDVLDRDNYVRCRAALRQLEAAVDAHGRSLTIHKLYLPTPMTYTEYEIDSLRPGYDNNNGTDTVFPHEDDVAIRLAGSYVNFYIANAAVIVPQFGDVVYDTRALEVLQGLFPTRRVIGIASCREILLGGGNIHCITQQVPAVTRTPSATS
jgi:agmatine deiminase